MGVYQMYKGNLCLEEQLSGDQSLKCREKERGVKLYDF